jgi:signal transduction histidine kinase
VLEYLGVVRAMRGFCVEFGEQQRMAIDFRSHDLPDPLPSPEVSLALFRVLQEALRNASKHSGVRHFEVELWGRRGEIYRRLAILVQASISKRQERVEGLVSLACRNE